MSLEELAEQFPDVSDMTLRRDLLQLEKENKVIRVRGGAMSVLEVQKRSGEAYAQKTTINTDAKKAIAKKTAALIDEGVSLFLDGGTTAMYLAKELPDRPCHIFTNGIAVAEELAHKKQPNVVLVGGTLIKENLSTASPYSRVFLENTNFELAIISASAFSFAHGFSCLGQVEADLLKFILDKAKMVYMMLDTSKIDKITRRTSVIHVITKVIKNHITIKHTSFLLQCFFCKAIIVIRRDRLGRRRLLRQDRRDGA